MFAYACKSATYKTPLIRFDDNNYLCGSHNSNTASTIRLVMAMLHFKFTGSFKSKIEYPINSGAYKRNSSEYYCYAKLYTKIKQIN
jgi:hypothetical protein